MRLDDPTWASVLADPIRLTVLRLLHRLGTADVRELAARAHTSNRTLRRHLEALVALGLVHQVDPERDSLKPGRPATQFLLDPQAREDLTQFFAALDSRDS
jgi:predicted ArsR family transcriptional regulator